MPGGNRNDQYAIHGLGRRHRALGLPPLTPGGPWAVQGSQFPPRRGASYKKAAPEQQAFHRRPVITTGARRRTVHRAHAPCASSPAINELVRPPAGGAYHAGHMVNHPWSGAAVPARFRSGLGAVIENRRTARLRLCQSDGWNTPTPAPRPPRRPCGGRPSGPPARPCQDEPP